MEPWSNGVFRTFPSFTWEREMYAKLRFAYDDVIQAFRHAS